MALNATVSGTISSPVDVDYFSFVGRTGQRVVVSCLASSIDSRLPAALELYDRAGSLLAANRGDQETDALLDAELAEDGEYLVRVCSFTYTQGSPDHFYRLSISTAPWIDAIVPPVVELGRPSRLTLYGRNLPGGQPDPTAVADGRVLEKVEVRVEVSADPSARQRLQFSGHIPPKASGLDGFEYRIRNDSGASNPFLLTFARGPVVLDRGNNNAHESAQAIEMPCEIVGCIERKRDGDWYAFTPRKGEAYFIDVFGDRLGAPVDLRFHLRNTATGRLIHGVDDDPQVLSRFQFPSWTSDPAAYRFLSTTVDPVQLFVSSQEAAASAGIRHAYRVCVAPEQPDFRLVVIGPGDPVLNSLAFDLPDAAIWRAGGEQFLWVYVWRKVGFNGEITLTAEGLPEGISCPPQVIGAGLLQGALALPAAAAAQPWTGPVRVTGSAHINGQEIVREARPAGIVWPSDRANMGMISRLNRELILAVRDDLAPPYRLNVQLDCATVPAGGRLVCHVQLERLWKDLAVPVKVTAINLPANVTAGTNNQPVSLTVGKDSAEIVLNVKEYAVPGRYSIAFQGLATVPYLANSMSGERPENIPLLQPSLPLLLTIVPRQPAK